MLNLFGNLRAWIALANQIAAQNPGDAPRWSLYLTNRSFIAITLAVLLNVAALAGWHLPLPTDQLADMWVQIITAGLAVYAFVERKWLGKTRVVWNATQAAKAIEEAHAPNTVSADKLAKVLKDAGAPVP